MSPGEVVPLRPQPTQEDGRIIAFCTRDVTRHRWWSVGESVERCPDEECDCKPELWVPADVALFWRDRYVEERDENEGLRAR